MIIGIISNNDLASSQRLSDQDGLQLKGKNNTIDQNITFEGIGDDATISGFLLVVYISFIVFMSYF